MRSDRYKNTIPWYKQFWGWVIIAAFIIGIAGILITALFDGANSTSPTSSGSAKDTSSPSQLTVGYEDYKVKDSKAYTINYSNNDWDKANVKIKKATVYKLNHPYKVEVAGDKKETVTGFIKLDMSVKALNDITIYPTQATANYNNEQAEGMGSDVWDGDINKGAQKSGTVYFPVKNLKNVSSISSLRLTFDGHNQKHIEDSYDYDITINLNSNKSHSNSKKSEQTQAGKHITNVVASKPITRQKDEDRNDDNLSLSEAQQKNVEKGLYPDGTRRRETFKSDDDYSRYNAWHSGYNYDPSTGTLTPLNDQDMANMRAQMNKDGGQSFQ